MTFGTRLAVTYAALRQEVLTVPAKTTVRTNPSILAATVSDPMRTAALPMPTVARGEEALVRWTDPFDPAGPSAGLESATSSDSARARRPPRSVIADAERRAGPLDQRSGPGPLFQPERMCRHRPTAPRNRAGRPASARACPASSARASARS